MEGKELTFQEVIASIKEGETYKCTSDVFIVKEISMNGLNVKFKIGHQLSNAIGVGISPEQRFVKVQEPVTFEEVLKSDKRCKVEHKLLNNYFVVGVEDYENIDLILNSITSNAPNEEVKQILLEAKWYLED